MGSDNPRQHLELSLCNNRESMLIGGQSLKCIQNGGPEILFGLFRGIPARINAALGESRNKVVARWLHLHRDRPNDIVGLAGEVVDPCEWASETLVVVR